MSAWGYAAINLNSFHLYYTKQIISHDNFDF